MLNNNKITGADSGFQVRGGALKKNCWGISCEKSRFYAKKSYFSNFRGAPLPGSVVFTY